MEKVKDVVFRVLRYNPQDDSTRWDEYKVPVVKGMTVLEGLFYIKENLDSTLTFRASCRMGVCGSCAMVVNGKHVLACQTQILKLHSDTLNVEPLNNYAIVKDLVPDLMPMLSKHRSVKPYIIRYSDPEEFNAEEPTGEYLQTPKELEEFLQFTYCIKCGACVSACPVVSGNEDFLGPQALTQAYRYAMDSRDEGYIVDRDVVSDIVSGVFRCHFVGACSDACPKGVDPGMALQLLKKEIFLNTFGLKGERPKAGFHRVDLNAPPPPDAPKPPPRTVN
ncbi:MAG: succinate dehydrogenase iron-sulfur subunit [Thermotogae bacterium]|nr:succinate dehydrogenase iron-sulfur subunit [Thermotogota bacterium]